MKGAVPIKAMLGADAGSFGVSLEMEEFCGGSLLPWQMMSISETKGQAAVDGK